MIDSGNLDVKIVRRGGIGMVKQFPFTLPVTKEAWVQILLEASLDSSLGENN